MICFCYFCEKTISPFWVWSIMTPFWCKLDPPPKKKKKKTNKQYLRDFTNFFSKLLDCNTSCELNPLTYFIGNQPKNTSGCFLWGKIWVKLGPMS